MHCGKYGEDAIVGGVPDHGSTMMWRYQMAITLCYANK